MTRDLLRYFRSGDRSTEGSAARTVSRRHVLAIAGAAGAGLGTVGVQLGGRGGGSPPTSRNGGGNVVKTTAVGDDPGREADRTTSPSATPATPVIGANLNGRPRLLSNTLELIDASNTTWIRAFLDVRRKMIDGRRPGDDPDVLALRQVARERNCRLVVSLKWDFAATWGDKESIAVPPPGSNAERELIRCALRYLRSIGAPIDVVVLGNEPMWETLGADVEADESPIVRFTRNVKDHLVRGGDHGDPHYLVGAFNRAHDDHTRERRFPRFYRQMFELAREDEDVDGVDLHVHYGDFAEAEAMVALARAELPDGMITATEFSPVWRYRRHVGVPIEESEAGERFARDHDLPTGMTAVEYFEHAKRNPRPPGEVADFYDAMPWYNVNHVEDVYSLFADFDVSVGTVGFLQGPWMRNEDWTTNWLPFHINFLFQPALIRTASGIENTAHRHYVEDYRERAVRGDHDA